MNSNHTFISSTLMRLQACSTMLVSVWVLLFMAISPPANCQNFPPILDGALSLQADQFPNGVVAGDFNSDGLVDLASANSTSDNVSVFLGKAQGTYADAVNYSVGANPLRLTVADIDEDTHLDLLVANFDSDTLTFLMGNGDGTFSPSTPIATGNAPFDIIAVDLNGDDDLDLAVSLGLDDDLAIYLGNGDGTFGSATTYSTGYSTTAPAELQAADFDGDTVTDIAVANYGSNNIAVFLGNGDGTFPAAITTAAGNGPYCIFAGHFDADSDVDLAVTNYYSDTISIMTGDGDGTFTSLAAYTFLDGPVYVQGTDLDGDTDIDLVVSSIFTHPLAILTGNGDGTFELSEYLFANSGPRTLDLSDINNDSIADLVVSSSLTNNLTVFRGKGDGSFVTPLAVNSGSRPYALCAGDFNSDGDLDVAAVKYTSNQVSVMLGDGVSSFTSSALIAVGGLPVGLECGYLNSDTNLDLISVNAGSDNISVMLGNGDGTFAAAVNYSVGNSPRQAVLGDFNEDTYVDVAVANTFDANVSVLLGDGTGALSSPASYAADVGPYAIAAGYLDGDTHLDLVVANRGTDNVSLLSGNGDGTFDAPQNHAAGDGAHDVVIGDFNGDSYLDLSTVNYFGSDVSVLLGDGSGNFSAAKNFDIGVDPERMVAADINGDGILDIAVANTDTDDISVLFGLGDGTFENDLRFASGNTPAAIDAGDFNNDGRMDIAVGVFDSINVAVFYNTSPDDVRSLSFGSHELYSAPVVDSLTIDNPSGSAINTTTTLADDGGGVFSISSSLPATIAGGNSESLEVTFTPDTLGAANGLVIIETDYPSSPTIYVNLNGAAVDTQLPSSNVTAPSGSTTSETLSVEWSGSDNVDGSGLYGVELFYQRSGGGYVSYGVFVSSPIAFNTSGTGGDGTYDFYTVAIDNAGNEEAAPGSADTSVFVDANAPTSQATGPGGTAVTSSINITWTGSDVAGGSGLANVELFYQRNGGGYTSYGTFGSSPISFNSAGTGGDGTYDFYTVASDNSGNTESGPVSADTTVTIDTVAPSSSASVSSTTLTTASINVSWTGGDAGGSGIANVQLFYRRNGGAYTNFGTFTSSPIAFDSAATGGDGNYDFYTVATDNAGNIESAPGSPDTSALIDANAPTSQVTGPSGISALASFNVTWTGSDAPGGSGLSSVALYYQLDGGGYVSYGNFASSPIVFDSGSTGGDGDYDFYTIAVDNAGLTEAAPGSPDSSVEIDTTAPSTTAFSSSITSNTSVLVSWSGSDFSGSGIADAELFYQFNGGGYTSYGTFASSPIAFDTSSTGGDGDYEFYTIATDNAGNVEVGPGTPDSTTTVDTTPPASQATGPSGVLTQANPVFDVAFTASDSGSGVSHVLVFYENAGTRRAYSQYPTTFTVSPGSFDTSLTGGDGTYNLYTVAVDNAGNIEAAPVSADTTVVFNDSTYVGEWMLLDE